MLKDLIKKGIGSLITFYRLSPWQPFRGIFLKFYLKHVEPRMYGGKRVIIAKKSGITYKLDLSDHQDMSIYYQGAFEPRTVAVFKKYVKPGCVVFDIGAHTGCHTLQLAKLAGPNGRVFAFEPSSVFFPKLKESIDLNDFTNILPIKCALSDVTPCAEPISYSIGGIKEFSEKVDVQVITLDDYVKANNVEAIDFIKLDTDGCEYQILQGARESLKKFSPAMIVELSRTAPERFNNTLEGLIALLSSYGYSFLSEKNLKPYKKNELLGMIFSNVNINVLCKKL